MTAAPIAIVEDEPKLASLLADYLQVAGYRTEVHADGLAAWDALQATPPALILLDLMLPGLDGLGLCRRVRAHPGPLAHVPILMVTARVEEIDRLIGLEAGADDYICKPFSPREVVARVKAVLRRIAPPTPTALALDPQRLHAVFHGIPVELTPAEYRLLEALMSHPGRIFSRDQLLDRLHADGRAVTDRAVDSHIRNLRRKLEAVRPDEEPIRAVYGMGYRVELG